MPVTRRLFGGQIVGQALVAAARAVSSDLQAHSLHCYFVRAGGTAPRGSGGSRIPGPGGRIWEMGGGRDRGCHSVPAAAEQCFICPAPAFCQRGSGPSVVHGCPAAKGSHPPRGPQGAGVV